MVDLGGGVSIKILAVNGNGEIKAGDFHLNSDAPSENDYSLGFLLTFNNFTEWFGGDLSGELSGSYHDIELSAAREIGDVDVYRVHHHGSSHSSNSVFVAQLDPEVSIISVGDNNTFGHPTQLVMDRLLATSTVYMTERGDPATDIGAAIVAGNILVTSSDGLSYTVNGTPYSTDTPTRVDADGDGYFSDAGIDPDDSNPDLIPAPNGGCDPTYQVCLCRATAGQVVLNEVLPAPSAGNSEWAELYNTTALPINIGLCNIDDADNTKNPSQIPANTIIAPHGFYLTPALSSYFNNTGDDARLLAGDEATVLDTFTFGATAYDLSWHRTPDGGPWAAAPGAPTSGTANNPLKTLTARSQLNYDGWILESTEKSGTGGTMNQVAVILTLGDDKAKKQYHSVLSFVTYALPDNAVITKVTLRLKYQSVAPAGTDPIALLQGIFVDVRKGYFGASPALELADFKFAASKTAGPFKSALASGWYTISLPQTTFASINKQTTLSGLTQFRLRFKLDDNNNAIANTLNIFSGNSVVVNRPALVIEYYIP